MPSAVSDRTAQIRAAGEGGRVGPHHDCAGAAAYRVQIASGGLLPREESVHLRRDTDAAETTASAHYTSARFLGFPIRVVATQSTRREVHLISSSLSAHTIGAVVAWVAAHPRVTPHYSFTYGSSLNQWAYSNPAHPIRVDRT
ncbi:MAG: Transposase [Gemmatimonadetes bacterium]|nr:Transposase [Gemmatimonadota bacterium]